MTDSITSMTEQSAVNRQILGLVQERLAGSIVMQLVEGVKLPEEVQASSEPQDPSTITSEQLKSPIDIRV
jgi:hypothetical protein